MGGVKISVVVAVAVFLLCGSRAGGYVEASCGDLVRSAYGQIESNFSHGVVGFKVLLNEASLTINNITVSLATYVVVPSQIRLFYHDTTTSKPGLVACNGDSPYHISGTAGDIFASFSACSPTPGTYWLVIGGPGNGNISSWIMAPWSSMGPSVSVSIAGNWAIAPDFAESSSGTAPVVVIKGCASNLAPSPSSSPNPTAAQSSAPSVSRTPSTSPTAIALPSPSAMFPSYSPLPSPEASSSPKRSRSPSTPSVSPSPSPSPALVSVTNLTAGFDDALATFNITGTVVAAGRNSSSVRESANVVSKFNGLQLGNLSVPADSLSDLARTVVNGSAGATTTYVYSASVGGDDSSTTRFDQSFTFYERATTAAFAGVTFDIAANSVKWSLNFTTSDGSTASHATQWSTVRYRLAGLLQTTSGGVNATALSAATDRPITRRAGTPAAGLTTYYVPLFVSEKTKARSTVSVVTATVVLFDVALIDGSPASIRHAITAVAVNESASSSSAEYEVVLEFPPFESSVFYDPSIGLGVLLGSNDDGSGGVGGDSANVGLIVGVAVAIPVAVVVVAVAIGVGVLVTWRKRRSNDSSRAINFSVDDQDGDMGL